MTAIMRIDQTGLSAGTAGVARDDGLSTGALVTVTSLAHQGDFEVALLWVGLHGVVDTTSRATLQKSGPASYSFSPTAGALGSWRIELVTDRGTPAEDRQVRIFAIRGGGLRIPAANEQADPEANLVNSSAAYVARSEFNAGDGVTDSPQEDASYVSHWRPLADLIHAHNTGGGGGGGGLTPFAAINLVPLGTPDVVDLDIPNIRSVLCQQLDNSQFGAPSITVRSILAPPPDDDGHTMHTLFVFNRGTGPIVFEHGYSGGAAGSMIINANAFYGGATNFTLERYQQMVLTRELSGSNWIIAPPQLAP